MADYKELVAWQAQKIMELETSKEVWYGEYQKLKKIIEDGKDNA